MYTSKRLNSILKVSERLVVNYEYYINLPDDVVQRIKGLQN